MSPGSRARKKCSPNASGILTLLCLELKLLLFHENRRTDDVNGALPKAVNPAESLGGSPSKEMDRRDLSAKYQ